MRVSQAFVSVLLGLGSVVSIAGCSGQRQARVVLEIEPAVARECELPTAVTVRWDASSLGLKLAKLEVNNIGRTPRLWTQNLSVGNESTGGGWAEDGFTVTLRSLNGVELARQTLTSVPCDDAR